MVCDDCIKYLAFFTTQHNAISLHKRMLSVGTSGNFKWCCCFQYFHVPTVRTFVNNNCNHISLTNIEIPMKEIACH